MIRAMVTRTIAAVVLAYGTGVIAYWVMYHGAGLQFRTADRAAFYVFCAAIPVLWAVLFFRLLLRRAPRGHGVRFGTMDAAQGRPPDDRWQRPGHRPRGQERRRAAAL